MNSIIWVATVLAASSVGMGAATVGCAKASGPPDDQKVDPLPAKPTHPIDRQTLAAAGYYSWDEAKLAWAERKKANLKVLDGSELVGQAIGDWQLSQWVNGSAKSIDDLRGQVVVVRFWTSPDCLFCSKTLPALQLLADEFADKPVAIIGAYHAKPEASVTEMTEPARLAAEWKVRFPIALDREWQTLKSWWLSSAPRSATSVTFVIGKSGRIAFVHPGPVFHPSKDPAEAKQNGDFLAVRQTIVAELTK